MGVDILICHDFFCGIDEQDVHSMFGCDKVVLEPAPAFADASFQKIALYCSFEEFLRNGNQNAAEFFSVVCSMDITNRAYTSVSAFSKKSLYGFLAAQSFFLRKIIWSLPVHDYLF